MSVKNNQTTITIIEKIRLLLVHSQYVSTLLHLQLQRGEQARLAFVDLHLAIVQSPLQEHFISSLYALETSGMVIQTGTHDFVDGTLDQAKSCGDGTILAVIGCWLSIFQLGTLLVEHAVGVHPAWVASCPCFGSCGKRALLLLH